MLRVENVAGPDYSSAALLPFTINDKWSLPFTLKSVSVLFLANFFLSAFFIFEILMIHLLHEIVFYLGKLYFKIEPFNILKAFENFIFYVGFKLQNGLDVGLGYNDAYKMPIELSNNIAYNTSDKNCNVYLLKLPYLYTVPNFMFNSFKQSILIVDARRNGSYVKLCECSFLSYINETFHYVKGFIWLIT